MLEMINLNTRLILLAGIGSVALAVTAAQVGSQANACQGVVHSVAIEEIVRGQKVAPAVVVDVPGHGKHALGIDTGASDSVVFARAKEGGYISQTHGGDSDAIGQQLVSSSSFAKLELPPEVATAARERGIDGILSPQSLYPNGYVVLDFKNGRLLEFTKKDDVVECLGHGLVVHKTSSEIEANGLGVDGELDSLVRGRLFVDTGSFLTIFYTDSLDYGKTEIAPELSIVTMKGERTATVISRDHSVRIGLNQRKLSVIAAPTDSVLEVDSDLTPDYIALLGYDALKESIIILPPASAGYWEIIF